MSAAWRIFVGAVTVITALGIVGSVWWYFVSSQDLQERWYADEQSWNAELLADMAELKRQAGRQSEDMEILRHRLNDARNDHHTAARQISHMAEKLEFHRGRHERAE